MTADPTSVQPPPPPTCAGCGCALGESAKVQPTTVDGEMWCPKCFVWHRTAKEPFRFHQSGANVVTCHRCGWLTVSFFAGASGGCPHCRKPGAKVWKATPADMATIRSASARLRAKWAAERAAAEARA